MKGRRKKGIAAVFMAALMLIGLVPSDFTLVSAKAGDTQKNTYTFNAPDVDAKDIADKAVVEEGTTFGTDGYFKSTGKVIYRTNKDGTIKALEIDKAETGAIQIVVQGTADATFSVSSTGGSNESRVALIDSDGKTIENTEKIISVKGTSSTIIKYEKLAAGTYKLVSPEDSTMNRGVRLISATIDDEFEVQPSIVTTDYTFNAPDVDAKDIADKAVVEEGTTFGTDGYFKSTGKVIYRTNKDGTIKALEIDKAETGAIQIVVQGTADATFSVSSTGGSNESRVALIDSDGKTIENTEKIISVKGTSSTIIKYEKLAAGTYKLVSPEDSTMNRGVRLISANVSDTYESKGETFDWSAVADPILDEPTVDVEKGEITVPFKMVVGTKGASKVTITMEDANGKVVGTKTSAADGESGKVVFKPSSSGNYKFSITASRSKETDKTGNTVECKNFMLPLGTPSISSSTSKGNGKIEVVWTSVKEADAYELYMDDALVIKTTELNYKVEGLEIGSEHSFKVLAVRGSEKSKASDVVKTKATLDEQMVWQFSAYGSSTGSKNKYSGDANDGSVTVSAMGNAGKIVPNSTDGVSFYYTKVPTTSNFTLRAKVHVNQWTLSNGQEGYGLMVADRVGDNGDATAFWNNQYQAIASKVEYYVDEETGEISDAGKKISMKIGLGVIAKTGVNKGNLDKFVASDTATINSQFKTETLPLDTSAMKLDAGTYNVIGNSTNTAVSDGLTALTDYYLTIQRNNTGYFVTYSDADGKEIKTQKYYDRDALSQLDEDYVYAGFFAARNAEATFSDISLELTDPATDAPAEAKPIKYVTPNYTVTSATATGNAEYLFRFVSTADGWLTIGGRDVEDEYVKANVEYTKKYTLTEGDNNFVITFTPDPNFVPLKGDKLTSYEPYRFTHTVKFKTYGQAKESIWVAPDGSPQGPGEESLPLDIYTAFKYAQPGQQIILKGGKYNLYSTVTTGRGNNGTADAYITVIADPNADERPVLDFNWSCAGMILAGDYWYFKGFDVTHSADALKGVQVSGSHNVLDQINTYHNGNTGIQISRYLSSDTWDNWPSYNLILNCTSYGNADKGYEDADGFAAKLTVADGNVFDGCISYNNADDGWDLFAKVETGSIGSVTLQNCVAYGNGYLEDGTDAGNGNGFKMGGDSLSGYHRLINSVAYNNKAKGIDSNSCPDIQVTSSTTFNNESYNVAFYTNTAANTDFGANGILSYRKDTNVAEQFKTKGTQDTSKIYGDKNYYWDTATKVSANKAGEAVDDSWFVTTDTSITPTRNADGTINMHGLLVLTDKAPEGVGARINGTPSAVIDKNDSVYYPTDSNEEVEDNTDAAITNPDVKGTINVIGQNIGAVVPAGTVIKNAAGATVTAGDVYVKAVPKAADDSTAASILEAAKNQGLKIADNAGVAYYDVELVDAAGNPLTFEGTITISFAYPDGTNADGFTFSVLHLLKSGTLDVIDPALNQAGLSVNVTEFSPFAVVYLQKAANGEAGQTIESAKTGDSTPIMPIVVILLASAAVICAGIVVSKKKRA